MSTKHSSHAILSNTEYFSTCLKSIFGWTACNLFLMKLRTTMMSDIANNSRFAQLYFLTNLSHFFPHDDSHVDVDDEHDEVDVDVDGQDDDVLESIHDDVVEVVSQDDSYVEPHDVLELVVSVQRLELELELEQDPDPELVHDVSYDEDDVEQGRELEFVLVLVLEELGVYDDEHDVDVDERYVDPLHELIPVTETNEQESVFSQL